MPNTLAHVAVQSLLLRGLRVPFTIIIFGCVIPDIPWIIQRLVHGLGIAEPSVSSAAFFVVQASFMYCLLACSAVAAFFKHPQTAFAACALGCGLHLLLDSLQDKWGNGVHFLAPLDWSMLAIGIYDTTTTWLLLISIAGLLPFIAFRQVREDAALIRFTVVRLAFAGCVLLLYLVSPYIFVSGAIESNTRYLDVLATQKHRVGRPIELDREELTLVDGTFYVTTHVGEGLRIAGSDNAISPGPYSLRGRFVSDTSIQVSAVRRETGYRDVLSMLGLLLAGGWIAFVVGIKLRDRPAT